LIRADGGGVRNQFFDAVSFCRPSPGIVVRTSWDAVELSALGAVLAGTLGLGIYDNLDDLFQVATTHQDYSPPINRAVLG
jgi:glycerol kinase